MAWGMLPSLGSAMCACTWHLFYNAPKLEVRCSFTKSMCPQMQPSETLQFTRWAHPCAFCVQWLVALQAGLTVVGNFACWWAAYRIYEGGKAEEA